MAIWRRLELWLSWFSWYRRQAREADLERELRDHLELEADEQRAAGLSPEEAAYAAHRALGNTLKIEEEVRATWGFQWFETFAQDIRYAFRMLRNSPGFTTVAILTLALGIGGTVAVFGVLDSVVLKPLPYPHPEQLVSINISPLAVDPAVANMAPEDYFIFREQGQIFHQIGIYSDDHIFSDGQVNVTGLAEPERVHALNATYDLLTTLDTPPALGRALSSSDDSPGAPLTVLLTYGYWQRKFGGDASAIGKTLIVDGQLRQIIGVLPRNFRFLDVQDLALILPLQLDRNKTLIGGFSYFGIARLKPGTTLAQATADAARLLPITLSSFPPQPGSPRKIFEDARLAPRILPLKDRVVGNVGAFLWVVMGGIGMVLLIACANVANLLLVRTEGRRHELALRAALGASRRRIAVQLLHESIVIGLLGGACGLILASLALRFLIAFAPAGLPRATDIGISLPVVYFAFAITLFTSLLFGMIPMLRHAGACAGLSEGDRLLSVTRESHRARNLLVVMQVALALVLLICSGLMIRTFHALTQVNPGFERPAELQTFRISIPESDVPDDASISRQEQQIQDQLAVIPGVSSVGFSSSVPLDGTNGVDNVFAEDHTYANGKLPPFRRLIFISPGYLRTMGTPIVAGRDLTWTDTYNKLPVALVSENFAREYWGSPTEALGKRIRTSSIDDWRQIVGVVGDVHDQSIDKPAGSAVYWPILLQNFEAEPLQTVRYGTFVVRSSRAGTESLLTEIRRAVWSVDAKVPLANVYTLNFLYDESLARTSLTLVMLGIAGAMALLLGAVGLYGVIAYSVSQRTREIGIRMALGAQRQDVMRPVLGEGVLVILMGVAVGVAGSLALTRFLSSLLYGVSPADPLTFTAVSILLMAVALAACYLPARRAMRVDPIVALRYE
jgi:predicted permease